MIYGLKKIRTKRAKETDRRDRERETERDGWSSAYKDKKQPCK